MRQILTNPILAVVGLAAIAALLLAPLVLRLAGLSGGQIVILLVETLKFMLALARELLSARDE